MMPRQAKGLTAAQVEKGTKPGRYGDGAGLYLLVRSRQVKFWVFRYTRSSKMREMGLGPAKGRTAVPLSQARAKARQLHAVVRDGRDPLAEHEAEKAKAQADAAKAKAAAMTFGEVADMYIAAYEQSWRSPKHRQQWHNTLRDYVLPAIGDLPVAGVGFAGVDLRAEGCAARPRPREGLSHRGRARGCDDLRRRQAAFLAFCDPWGPTCGRPGRGSTWARDFSAASLLPPHRTLTKFNPKNPSLSAGWFSPATKGNKNC
jgi:hypothetical protein